MGPTPHTILTSRMVDSLISVIAFVALTSLNPTDLIFVFIVDYPAEGINAGILVFITSFSCIRKEAIIILHRREKMI